MDEPASKTTSIWVKQGIVVDLTTVPDSDIIKGAKSRATEIARADVLVVDGTWEDSLRCSVESLVARLYGKTLVHDSFLKGADKYKSCKFAPPLNPTRVTISEKFKLKHPKIFKVLQMAAVDRKIQITEKAQLGQVQLPKKKEAIYNLHSIMLHEELARTMGEPFPDCYYFFWLPAVPSPDA